MTAVAPAGRSEALPPPPVSYEQGWRLAPDDDPLIPFLLKHAWAGSNDRSGWQVRRLTGGAYLYRAANGWCVVGKFYSAKTKKDPLEVAAREMEAIRHARALLGAQGHHVVRSFALWRGVLLLEFVPGLTLEETITAACQEPKRLTASLTSVASFLALLHSRSTRADVWPDFRPARFHAHKVIGEVESTGILNAEKAGGMMQRVDEAATSPLLQSFTPVYRHGDATTGNFLFDRDRKLITVDWERAELGDPAADLGRLLAETGHSMRQQGCAPNVVVGMRSHIRTSYRDSLAKSTPREPLWERSRFYEAISMLRIARNPWVASPFRHRLVEDAAQLLN